VLKLLDDFPGANIGPGQVDGNRVRLRLRRDPVTRADGARHDYNYHFVFGLQNQGPAPCRAQVGIEAEGPQGLSQRPLLYAAATLEEEFAPANVGARYDGGRAYWLELDLAAGQSLYLANTYFQPPARLAARLAELAAAGGARAEAYGHSLQGRDLVAYHYPAAQGPEQACVFITSGFHPPEPDTLASQAVMQWLASPQASEARQRLSFCLAPMVNPDGFFLGTQGHNAAGVNFYWEFRPERAERIPEAAALWALAQRLQPALYFDFHAYTFQGAAKAAGPYLKPQWHYRGLAVRTLAADMERRLLEFTGGACMRGASPLALTTLQSRLTRRFNTVTFAKYHLHLGQGLEACREHGRQVVAAAALAMLDADLTRTADILAAPYGRQPRDPLRSLAGWSQALWEGPSKGFLRPLLGR